MVEDVSRAELLEKTSKYNFSIIYLFVINDALTTVITYLWIGTTKAQVEARSNGIEEHIARHYLRSSSTEKGLILWLKPGVQRRIQPEPIHLKEVVSIRLLQALFIVSLCIKCF